MNWTPQDVISLVTAIGAAAAAVVAAYYGRRASHGIEDHEEKAEGRRQQTEAALEATAGLVSAHERNSRLRMQEHEVEAERRAVMKTGARKPKVPVEPGRCPTCGRKKPGAPSLAAADEFCEGEEA